MTDETMGQVPDESVQATQPDQPGNAGAQGQEPEQFDAEYVKRLRAEAAEYRKRLRELESRVRADEEAKLSETERLQKHLAELEREQALYQRERQERTLKYETMLAANRLGIVDPEVAYRLVDLSRVEFDDDGRPANLETILRELLKAKPYLSAAIPNVAPTNPANPARQPQVFTRSQLRDTKFFAEHQDEIMRALREGRILDE